MKRDPVIEKTRTWLLVTLLILIFSGCAAKSMKTEEAEESSSAEFGERYQFEEGQVIVDKGTKNAVIHLNVTNDGPGDDTLLSISTPVAEIVEIRKKNDLLVKNLGLECNETTKFHPKGPLLMTLKGLKKPIKHGDTIKLNLTFQSGDDSSVDLPVVSSSHQ